MKITRILTLALIATLSLGFVACGEESLSEQADKAAGDLKDKLGNMSVDSIKEKLGGIGDLEQKAKDMGKAEMPELKSLLSKKDEIQKFVDGLKGMDAAKVVEKLKEIAPQVADLDKLMATVKSKLGM